MLDTMKFDSRWNGAKEVGELLWNRAPLWYTGRENILVMFISIRSEEGNFRV